MFGTEETEITAGQKAHAKRKKKKGGGISIMSTHISTMSAGNLAEANKADEKEVPLIDELEARECFLADMRQVHDVTTTLS